MLKGIISCAGIGLPYTTNKEIAKMEQLLQLYTEKLTALFPGRILFLGIQGSHQRGEATETSDLDMVTVLDRLDFSDLAAYRRMLGELPTRPTPCGFICGREDLEHWPKSDLFSLYWDTRPLMGSLDSLIKQPEEADIRESIRIGGSALFHEICHREIYGHPTAEKLRASLKSARFLGAARAYLRTGRYEGRLAFLRAQASGVDREILDRLAEDPGDLGECGELLLRFSRLLIGG